MSAKSRLGLIAERRAQLLARADAQRDELARYARQFESPARLVQTGLGLMNSIRQSPLLITGLAALLMRTPWRKIARVPKLAWRGWKILQFVRRWT